MFAAALAGGADRVWWGLRFPEYVREVADQLEFLDVPVQVTVAASGEAGSSPEVFGRLTRFLGKVLEAAALPGDDVLWDMWWRSKLDPVRARGSTR